MTPCICYNIEIRGDKYIHPWSPDVHVGVVEGLKEHVVKQEILSQAVFFFFFVCFTINITYPICGQ